MGHTVVHPGQHLAERLEALDLSAAELSRQSIVPGNRINQIITGNRAITGDTTLRLGHYFGSSLQFWLSLHTTYDLRVAEDEDRCNTRHLSTLLGRPKRNTADHATTIRIVYPNTVQHLST